MRGGHVHSFGLHPHHEPSSHPREQETPVRRGDLTGFTLALIVGFNPCILIIPIVFSAAQMGRLTLVAVTVSFGVMTVATMVGATLIGLRGTARLTSSFLTRYGEALSGGLIALTGIVVMLISNTGP